MTIAELEREQIQERMRECAEAHAEGRTAERARIVAWLRERADDAARALVEEERDLVAAYLRAAADLIEAKGGPDVA